jgi:hypothetical protein
MAPMTEIFLSSFQKREEKKIQKVTKMNCLLVVVRRFLFFKKIKIKFFMYFLRTYRTHNNYDSTFDSILFSFSSERHSRALRVLAWLNKYYYVALPYVLRKDVGKRMRIRYSLRTRERVASCISRYICHVLWFSRDIES